MKSCKQARKCHKNDLRKWRVGFTHTGGGCLLVPIKRKHKKGWPQPKMEYASKFPCDDTYESNATGREITVTTTQTRHWDMPENVKSMSQVYRLSGVKRS